MMLVNLGCGKTYHTGWKNYDFVAPDENVIQHDLLTGVPLPDGVVDVVYHSHVLEHFSREAGVTFLKECYRVLKRGGIIRIAVPDLENICRAYLASVDEVRSGRENSQYDHQWMIIELIDQLVRSSDGGEMAGYWKKKSLPNKEFIYQRLGQEFARYRAYIEQAQIYDHVQPLPTWRQKFRAFLAGCKVEDIQYIDFRSKGEIHRWMYDEVSLTILLKDLGFQDIKVCEFAKSNIQDWADYQLEIRDGVILKPDSLIIEARKP
ncbi:MAG TPA: methyltransferase domain-containing protein [Alphaproteobacteria bacterium]